MEFGTVIKMKLNKKEFYEWLRRSEDIKMADGTTVRKYHLEFDTTDYKAVQYASLRFVFFFKKV